MCGIFGLIHTGDYTSQKLDIQIRHLFELTEPRGKQAAGIAILQDKNICVYKRPVNARELIKSIDYLKFTRKALQACIGSTAAIGHCRLTTDGSELIPQHNQPFITKNLVGIHNGVINNFERLRDEFQIPTEGEADSEVAFNFINLDIDRGKTPENAVINFYKLMRGSASIGILLKDYNRMIIATNFGSLYYSSEILNQFVFASEKKILVDFAQKLGIKIKPKKLEPGTGLSIDSGSLESTKFNLGENSSFPETTQDVNENKIIQDLSPKPDKIKRCTKCILPENYPFLDLDNNGVCNICNKYQKQKFKGRDQLEKLLEKYRSANGEVDCLVGLSGGRDSSFGLHILKNELGMNPVGFSYDWLLTSRKARHNIAKMAGALGVEVIYRCGNYERQARNIRKNINGFLHSPDLGMLTFVQAGDKEMYHFGRKIRKEKDLKLTVWCSGYQLEQREFFIGYCGINKTLVNNPRLYDYGWVTKLQLGAYYGLKTLKNPYFWNRSIWDNLMAFWHCFVAKDDFLYLFNYYPWNEQEVEQVLREKYQWEADLNYGVNQWRMDDFHTSFINYVYYTMGGFSEFDDFRSNQVREGLITRDEALRLAAIDNTIRYESLLEFSNLVGFNLEHVLKKIDSLPKLYRY